MAVEFVSAATGRRSPQAHPFSRNERIEAIDALRGIALFGVLMVNLVTSFRVSFFSQFLPPSSAQTGLDALVESFVFIGLNMKAWSLFSLLFGIGLAIQFERLASRPDRTLLLLRRLGALLLFGLIHLFLIWNGDILTAYAILGFIALPLLFAPQWLLGISSVAFLFFYGLMPVLRLPIPFPQQDWIVQHIAEANVALGGGDYPQALLFNIREIPSILPLHLHIVPRTLGLFALGAWLWRSGLFQTGDRGVYARLGIVGVALGLLLTLAGEQSGIADQLAPVVLALGYAGIILYVATDKRTRRLVSWAVPIGRTAFSNYILQSVIFGLIFFGYGFGFFGRLTTATTFALGVGVYIAQVMASAHWLRHFQFGPIEWLWRALMYGKWPPLRRLANQQA